MRFYLLCIIIKNILLYRKHRRAGTDNVVVVSIIGKSSLNMAGLKMKSIGRLFPLEGRPPGEVSNCLTDSTQGV